MSVSRWFSGVLEDLTSLEARFPKTLKLLLLQPGRLTIEWNRGRRRSYTSPLRLYLVAAALFLLLWPLAAPQGGAATGATLGVVSALFHEEDGSNVMEAKVARRRAIEERAERWVSESFRWLMLLVMVPAFSGVSARILGRREDYFTSHLVFSLHAHAFLYLLIAALTPLTLVGLGGEWAILIVITVLSTSYVWLAARRVFERGVVAVTLRVAAAVFLYGFCFVLMAVTIALAAGMTHSS